MTAVLANVTIDYAQQGEIAVKCTQIGTVEFDPDPALLILASMLTATFIDDDTVDVQYEADVTAADFLAGDFLDSNQPANPSVITQQASDTLRLTGWDNPIAQNDTLAYTGHAVGITSPQTINID